MFGVDGKCQDKCYPTKIREGRPKGSNREDVVIDFPEGEIGDQHEIGKVVRGYNVETIEQCGMACKEVNCLSFAYMPEERRRTGATQMCYLFNTLFQDNDDKFKGMKTGMFVDWDLYSTGNCQPMRFFRSGSCENHGCKMPEAQQCEDYAEAVGAQRLEVSKQACRYGMCWKWGDYTHDGIGICTKKPKGDLCSDQAPCLCDCSLSN